MAVSDGQRFTVIFIFAVVLICGAFGLYVTKAQDFFAGLGGSKDTKTAVYENDQYGFYLLYPNTLTADATTCTTESKPCIVRFIDKNVPVATNGNINTNQKAATTERTLFTILVEPQKAVTHCDALNGRVEGGFTIGLTIYQPCVTPKTVSVPTFGMHIETTLAKNTYTFSADDYYGDRALLQAILGTFQTIIYE